MHGLRFLALAAVSALWQGQLFRVAALPTATATAAATVTRPAPYQSTSTTAAPPMGTDTSTTLTAPAAYTKTDTDGDCTVYVLKGVQFTFGPTWTVWPATATETMFVDCGGCGHCEPYFVGGHGPVVSFNTTVTATMATTTTELACLPTPEGNGPARR